jgi:hypothetical protein
VGGGAVGGELVSADLHTAYRARDDLHVGMKSWEPVIKLRSWSKGAGCREKGAG